MGVSSGFFDDFEHACSQERREIFFKIAREMDARSAAVRDLGCRAVLFSVDDFTPEDSYWVHLIGTDEQIAASYHYHQNPDKMNLVTELRSLVIDEPVGRWTDGMYGAQCQCQITESLQKAIITYDRASLLRMTEDESRKLRAEELFPYQLTQRLAQRQSAVTQKSEPVAP